MNKIFGLLLLIVLSASVYANEPEDVSYQKAVLDNSSQIGAEALEAKSSEVLKQEVTAPYLHALLAMGFLGLYICRKRYFNSRS